MKILCLPSEFKSINIKCRNCSAELECEFSDFKRDSYSDFRESWDHAIAICAACSSKIIVDKSNFPIHVYERLPRVLTFL